MYPEPLCVVRGKPREFLADAGPVGNLEFAIDDSHADSIEIGARVLHGAPQHLALRLT
jgi:hypothetical protein